MNSEWVHSWFLFGTIFRTRVEGHDEDSFIPIPISHNKKAAREEDTLISFPKLATKVPPKISRTHSLTVLIKITSSLTTRACDRYYNPCCLVVVGWLVFVTNHGSRTIFEHFRLFYNLSYLLPSSRPRPPNIYPAVTLNWLAARVQVASIYIIYCEFISI